MNETTNADIALQSLTPGGSEYVNDPAFCVAYVRDERRRKHEMILKLVREKRHLQDLLADAVLQIEYLHEKFQETGSGNAVLARIKEELGP